MCIDHSPATWVDGGLKVFLDRITDFLELPDLVNHGRRLRGKTAYVVCTSIYDQAPASFIGAFTETFAYLGMRFGGVAHANCHDGYIAAKHDDEAKEFARLVKSNADRSAPV